MNIQPLRDRLNAHLSCRGNYDTMRLVHRKMDVLRFRHGMHIKKHGKEPYIYEVKTLAASTRDPGQLNRYDRQLRANLALLVKLAVSHPDELEQHIDDCMDRLRAEFRWGPV